MFTAVNLEFTAVKNNIVKFYRGIFFLILKKIINSKKNFKFKIYQEIFLQNRLFENIYGRANHQVIY